MFHVDHKLGLTESLSQTNYLLRRPFNSLGVQANQQPTARLELHGVSPVAVEALLYVFVCLEKTNYST